MINVQLVCFCGPLAPCWILELVFYAIQKRNSKDKYRNNFALSLLVVPFALHEITFFLMVSSLSLSFACWYVDTGEWFIFVRVLFLSCFCPTLTIRLKVLLLLLLLMVVVGLFFFSTTFSFSSHAYLYMPDRHSTKDRENKIQDVHVITGRHPSSFFSHSSSVLDFALEWRWWWSWWWWYSRHICRWWDSTTGSVDLPLDTTRDVEWCQYPEAPFLLYSFRVVISVVRHDLHA